MSFGGFFRKWCCCCCSRNDGDVHEFGADVSSSKYTELNYENVISVDSIRSKDGLYASYIADNCIHLGSTIEELSESHKARHGWKLHIGVDSQDIPKAWNIIKDILIRYHIFHAKCMLQKTAFQEQNKDNGQGREITIYAFNEPAERNNWDDLLHELDRAIDINHIQEVRPSPACAQLSGYQHISCRCDQGKEDNEYLSHKDAIKLAASSEYETYNPYNRTPPTFLSDLIKTLSPGSLKMEL